MPGPARPAAARSRDPSGRALGAAASAPPAARASRAAPTTPEQQPEHEEHDRRDEQRHHHPRDEERDVEDEIEQEPGNDDRSDDAEDQPAGSAPHAPKVAGAGRPVRRLRSANPSWKAMSARPVTTVPISGTRATSPVAIAADPSSGAVAMPM